MKHSEHQPGGSEVLFVVLFLVIVVLLAVNQVFELLRNIGVTQ